MSYLEGIYCHIELGLLKMTDDAQKANYARSI
jgi:hypothetical protein